ncbi:MAG: uracil-DNA glycosylase [Thermoplasmata archaeon]|nr:MAG: uracil-DNA glycosylase [Thermoplasmata archaeon]
MTRLSPQGVDLDCQRCPLSRNRTQVVPGSGDPRARLMLVGEAPGANEDEGGEPFIGRAGRILDKALEEAGLSRERVWIANTVRCRPPDNRAPRDVEIATCSFQLEAELDAVGPRVLVALGATAAGALVGRPVALKDEAGSVHSIRRGGIDLRCVITYHPAGLIYRPTAMPQLVDDLTLAWELSRG